MNIWAREITNLPYKGCFLKEDNDKTLTRAIGEGNQYGFARLSGQW